MPILNVGDLYDPEQTHYDIEGPQWHIGAQPMQMMVLDDFDIDGDRIPFEVLEIHTYLLQYYRNPTVDEIALHEQPGFAMQFALIPGQHAMMLSYRFELGDWTDAPFQNVCQSEPPNLPDPQGRFHVPLWIALIDSATGILRAGRTLTWPPEFGDAVRAALAAQERAGQGMSREVRLAAGREEITAWVRKHPTPAALVDAEATMIVRGGKHSKILRHRQ